MSSRPEDVYPPILPDAQIIALEIVVDEPYITAWRCWICLGVSGQTAGSASRLNTVTPGHEIT